MTSMSFKGKEYKTNDILRECVEMSQELADRAKLNTPLPDDTDLAEADLQKVKEQVKITFSLRLQVLMYSVAFRNSDSP
jgi:hypothetical protein